MSRRPHRLSHGGSRCLAARQAIGRLREARDLLIQAGATQAVKKVRRALKSAEGAHRNAVVHREDA